MTLAFSERRENSILGGALSSTRETSFRETAVHLNVVRKIDGAVPVRHVLVSVADKSGLELLVSALLAAAPGLTIYSTGGTFDRLRSLVPPEGRGRLLQVSEYTGQPEMQGGLVKTLDFRIYLGLLSETYNEAHRRDLERTASVPIDMVVSNLYPFSPAIAAPGATAETARSNIDIGGPCMVRAAAKNYLRVASVTDPADYAEVADEIRSSGGSISLATRFRLAQKAFRHTAEYDELISRYLGGLSLGDVERCYEVEGREKGRSG